MIKNYIKVFFRNIIRQKTTSLINIAGLALAIAGCAFILLFVFDEFKYDQFHENKERVFRYVQQSKTTGDKSVLMSAKIFPSILAGVPEIESGFRIFRSINQVLGCNNDRFIEQVYYADNEILTIMTFPLISGNPRTALADPFSMVLTEAMAEKYFGKTDPIGKTLRLGNKYDFKITGVLKNIPANSHLKPSIIASMCTLNITQPFTMESLYNQSSLFYFLLKPNTSKDVAAGKIQQQVNEIEKKKWGENRQALLEPLPEIYLHPADDPWDYAEHGDIKEVRSFIAIALLILLMASFNYTNILTTFVKIREKELAARKLLGAGKGNLIVQFLSETCLSLFIALSLAIILDILLMNEFNQLTGKLLSAKSLMNPEIIFSMLILLLITAVLSVIYPLYIVFKSDTLNRIKGNSYAHRVNRFGLSLGFRQLITGLQFVITVGLLIAVGIIYSQLQYAANAKLGFNKQHLLVIENPFTPSMFDIFETYRSKIIQYPQVVSVSAGGNIPSENINNFTFTYLNGKTINEKVHTGQIAIDYDLLKTLDVKILAGRDFSRDIASDKDNAVIINSALAKALNTPDLLGKELNNLNNAKNGQRIIGVTDDIHFKSFKEKTMPIVFYLRHWSAENIVVRIKGDNIPFTLKILENNWKQVMPDRPFAYYFVDESFDNLYKNERRTEKLLMVFSFFAITIASLGLFSLITLIAQTKKKEIGIRKVLGESVTGIVIRMLREFIVIILAANIFAWPIAYYFMNKWLQGFVYRIEISWWTFILSTAAALFIALVTISYQAIKAALANPVKSLRYE